MMLRIAPLAVLGIFQGLVVGRRSNLIYLIYLMLPPGIEAAPHRLERPQALGKPTRRLESLAKGTRPSGFDSER